MRIDLAEISLSRIDSHQFIDIRSDHHAVQVGATSRTRGFQMCNGYIDRQDRDSVDCFSCAVRSRSICNALDEDELREFGKMVRSVNVGSKRNLFMEGECSDSIYNVVYGTVRFYNLLPDGRRQILGFAVPGDFIGFSPGVAYGFTADAIETVIVCRFSKEKFSRLIAGKPHILQRMNDFAQRELAMAQSHMVSLGRRTAVGKVAAFLIGWRSRLQNAGRATELIYLPMNRPDIADYLGLTIETVSRTLTKLERDGVIVIVPGGVRLMDAERAKALAAA